MIDKNVYCGIVGRAINNWYLKKIPVKDTLTTFIDDLDQFVLTLSTPFGFKHLDVYCEDRIASFLIVEDCSPLLKKLSAGGFEKSSFLSSVCLYQEGNPNKAIRTKSDIKIDISKYVYLCHLIIMGMEFAKH